MRAAQYICTLPPAEAATIRDMLAERGADMRTVESLAESCLISHVPCDIDASLRQRLAKILLPGGMDRARNLSVHCTRAAHPHVDEGVVGDYTAILVLEGAHVLFTGNGRPVCDLTPGVVCLLNNKRMHGARPKTEEKGDLLLFVTADFCAVSMREALKVCNFV